MAENSTGECTILGYMHAWIILFCTATGPPGPAAGTGTGTGSPGALSLVATAPVSEQMPAAVTFTLAAPRVADGPAGDEAVPEKTPDGHDPDDTGKARGALPASIGGGIGYVTWTDH